MIDHLSAAPSVLLQGFDQVDDLRLLRAVRDRDSGFLGHFQKFVLRELRQWLVAVARGGDRLRIVEGDQVRGLLELFQNEVAMGFQDRAGSNVLELHVLFLLSNGRHADQAEVTLVE